MKKILLLLLTAGITFLFAAEDHGVRAKVDLVSGVTQYAQFIGIQQDSVLLGGNIKGQFTIIKIAKNRFKSIVDEQGNDLLNPKAQQVADTTATQADSSQEALPEQSTEASTEQSEEQRQPTFLDSVAGKHIFVALEKRSIDSALDAQLSPILLQLIKESGTPLVVANRTQFGYCRSSACIKDSLALYGAASVYQGSISAGASQDSLTLYMTHLDLTDSTTKPLTATANLSVFNGLGDAITDNKLSNFIKQLKGEPLPTKKRNVSYVKLESEPEGATITIPGKDDICKTPCTFALQDTEKVDIYAYWKVNSQIWGAKKTIKPIPYDTTKLSVKLKKVKPELRVFTIPEGAYIYAGSSPISPTSHAIGKSPNKFDLNDIGSSFIQIRKEGFKDTLVSFYASPTDPTSVNVTLQPITTPVEMEIQNAWVKEQKKNFIGKVLMGSSIAPLLAGALLSYLANQDYDDARHIKDQLNIPSTLNGSHYQAQVNKNHDLVKKGDRKLTVGGSLIGTGILMFGVGFLLTF